jgi:hypothetical protein
MKHALGGQILFIKTIIFNALAKMAAMPHLHPRTQSQAKTLISDRSNSQIGIENCNH